MDPSEFEDTVDKKEDALNAGVLEAFLHGPTPEERFTPFDIMKESGDIYLALYNLQEGLKKFPGQTFDECLQQLDDKAIAIAQYKEEYLQRRKKLSAQVKKFLSETLPATDPDEAESVTATLTATREVIELFKAEYDHVANFSKFSEAAFLFMYKETREYLGDSRLALEQAVANCLQTQEVFKRVAEQFKLAEKELNLLSEHHHSTHASLPPSMSTASLAGSHPAGGPGLTAPIGLASEHEKWQQRHQEELALTVSSLQATHQLQILELQKSHEAEMQRLQWQTRQQQEDQHYRERQTWEEERQVKETEISRLRLSCQELQVQLQQTRQQDRLASEQQRRVQAEDRLREMLVERGEREQERQREREEHQQQLQHLQQLLQQHQQQLQSALQDLAQAKEETERVRQSQEKTETWSSLAHQLGLTDTDSSTSDLPSSPVILSQRIVERVRRLERELVQERQRQSEQQKTLQDSQLRVKELEAETNRLQSELQQTWQTELPPLSSMTVDANESISELISGEDREKTESATNSLQQVQGLWWKQRQRLVQQLEHVQRQVQSVEREKHRGEEENLVLFERCQQLQLQLQQQTNRRGGDLEQGDLHHHHHRTAHQQQQQSQSQHRETDWKYEQLSRKQLLLRLFPDRFGVYARCLRAILLDELLAYLLAFYLVCLHLLVAMAMWQWLTPQLAEEIQERQAAKWREETMAKIDLHPDLHE